MTTEPVQPMASNAVSPKQLVVLSFDGLCRDSIGAFGCHWNSTPAMDAVAASGIAFDRCILDDDSAVAKMDHFWSRDHILQSAEFGETVLVTDDMAVADQGEVFDRIVLVDPLADDEVDGSLEQTRMGKLFVAAVEADAGSHHPISLLWIHGRSLRDRWDAPEHLAPQTWDPEDSDDPEMELLDNESEAEQAVEASSFEVPFFEILATDDPDIVGQWVQRYATQVRLLDVLIEILLASLSIDDPQLAIVSTSGFSLGQNGHVGFQAGPIRSPQIHVPLIISDVGPRRWRPLTTPGAAIADLMRGRWSSSEDAEADAPSRIETSTQRAQKVITTDHWFAVVGPGDAEALFVKPDDVHDASDVAKRRLDIVDELSGETPER